MIASISLFFISVSYSTSENKLSVSSKSQPETGNKVFPENVRRIRKKSVPGKRRPDTEKFSGQKPTGYRNQTEGLRPKSVGYRKQNVPSQSRPDTENRQFSGQKSAGFREQFSA